MESFQVQGALRELRQEASTLKEQSEAREVELQQEPDILKDLRTAIRENRAFPESVRLFFPPETRIHGFFIAQIGYKMCAVQFKAWISNDLQRAHL